MADHGKKHGDNGSTGGDDVNPYTGKGYSADEMPTAPSIPTESYGQINPVSPLFPQAAPKWRPPMALPRPPKDTDRPADRRTDFESARLNDMVDLVENSVPDDLIDVGEALWKAARAIRKAEEELKTYFSEVDWGGEGKSAFDDWGKKLRENTLKLSEYAGAVGTQLNAAGAGLAMVKSQMPKKSSVVTVNDIPAPARVPGNPMMPAERPLLTGNGRAPLLDGNGKLTGGDSTPLLNNGGSGTGPGGTGFGKGSSPLLGQTDARTELGLRAVHPDSPEGKAAERDRQEAITQLNKLSSYYAISRQSMQSAEGNKPVFPALPTSPNLPGDPRATGGPTGGGAYGAPGGQGTTPVAGGSGAGEGQGAVGSPGRIGGPQDPTGGIGDGGRPDVTDLPPAGTVQDPLNRLDPSGSGAAVSPSRVGTDIDSTNMPPTGTIDPVSPNNPAPISNPTQPGPPTNGPGPVTPVGPPVGQPGPVGRGPVAPMPVTPPATGQGRQIGGPGRSIPTGTGPSGGGPGTASRPPMAGMPYAPMTPGVGQGGAGAGGAGSGAARASRPGGIVGGTPSSTSAGAGGATSGQGGTGARGPMGMMPMGAMGAMGAGAAGTGAVGARGNSGRRIASAPGGIVGTPRTGTSGQGRGSREFTPGGTGLVPGATGARSGDRDERRGNARPDYLTEDEETWTNGQRGSVPPVIE